MSGTIPVAEGITNPPIDELLEKTDSKYKLVLYSAKRARQINAYYSQLGEGLLEYVGPLVDTHVQEKPLSVALREINADLLTCEDIDEEPTELTTRAGSPEMATPTGAPGSSRPRVLLGVSGGIAAYKACELLRRFTETGHDVTVVPTRAAPDVRRGRDVGGLSGKPVSTDVFNDVPSVAHVRIGQQADLAVVAPATADLLARAARVARTTSSPAACWWLGAPSCMRRRCTPRCGSTRPRRRCRHVARAGALVIDPAYGRLTGVDTGPGRLPEPAEDLRVRRRRAGTCRGRCRPRGAHRPRRTQGRDLGGWYPRVPRSGAVPRQPLVRQAGLRTGRCGGGTRRRGDPGCSQRRAAGPGRRQGRARGVGPGSARRRARRVRPPMRS